MRFKRLLCLLVCLVTVATVAITGPGYTTAEAKSVSQYKSDLAEIQSQSAAIKKEISRLEAENAPYAEKKAALQKQINNTQDEIDLLNKRMEEIDRKVAQLEKNLAESKELFKQRLVAMYLSGANSSLNVLLSADDFADYLAKSELIRSVTEYDTKLMDQIVKDMEELKPLKAELNDAKAVVAERQAELSKQYDAINAVVKKYQNEIGDLEDALAQKKKDEADIAQAIKDAQANSGAGAIVGTGRFSWPVPGCYSISSYFGYRWGRLHGGIDISKGGIYGSRIIASDSGRVILSKYYSGYGYCVMIDHGNGYVTLYAHMKAQSPLSNGQNVSKGQTVGYVGSTGNSTGPHLHFEIRVNGVQKNPMNWF